MVATDEERHGLIPAPEEAPLIHNRRPCYGMRIRLDIGIMQITIDYADGAILHLLYAREFDINRAIGFLDAFSYEMTCREMRKSAERGQEQIGNIPEYRWEPVNV